MSERYARQVHARKVKDRRAREVEAGARWREAGSIRRKTEILSLIR